jgi:3-phenylpropionate/cinnamic acid dioxygenase small subunit
VRATRPRQLEEWLEALEPDISYRAPVLVTHERTAGPGFSATSWHFLEDHASLTTRVLRLETEYAWAEDPPSRTRRFVSSIRAPQAEAANELAVAYNLLLYRGRMGGPEAQLLSCERHDRLRSREARGGASPSARSCSTTPRCRPTTSPCFCDAVTIEPEDP